jgi:hypothetical protein
MVEAILVVALRIQFFIAPFGLIRNENPRKTGVKIFSAVIDFLFLFNITRVIYSRAIK